MCGLPPWKCVVSLRGTGIQDQIIGQIISRNFMRVIMLQALLPHLLPRGINVMAFDFVGSGMSDVCALTLMKDVNLLCALYIYLHPLYPLHNCNHRANMYRFRILRNTMWPLSSRIFARLVRSSAHSNAVINYHPHYCIRHYIDDISLGPLDGGCNSTRVLAHRPVHCCPGSGLCICRSVCREGSCDRCRVI